MKKILPLVLLLPSLLSSLEERPWFSEFLEFEFKPFYEYNFFRKVDRASPQLKSSFHTHVLGGGLSITAPDDWSWEAEIEFADTSSVSWGYRSFALQLRKRWLDDVCGDLVSLTTGFVYRDASDRMRRALSTPYHGRANFEFNTVIGKEWSQGAYWYFRVFGLGAVGQATSGLPWVRADLTFSGNYEDQQEWSLYARSLFGLGSRSLVPTEEFSGWGRINHHSVDLGASYRYRCGFFGDLRFDYLHRVYARSYPEQVNFFLLTYSFPFSIF
ncbi:MAG: hypothetical protein KR126chlam1_00649 [Chlamydiae bacterium]|nr:hypothetical protein [Chlamydiota bacterium]